MVFAEGGTIFVAPGHDVQPLAPCLFRFFPVCGVVDVLWKSLPPIPLCAR